MSVCQRSLTTEYRATFCSYTHINWRVRWKKDIRYFTQKWTLSEMLQILHAVLSTCLKQCSPCFFPWGLLPFWNIITYTKKTHFSQEKSLSLVVAHLPSATSIKVWKVRTAFRLIKFVLYHPPCLPMYEVQENILGMHFDHVRQDKTRLFNSQVN